MITLWLLMGMEMFRHGDIEHHNHQIHMKLQHAMDLKLLMLLSIKVHKKNPCSKCIN